MLIMIHSQGNATPLVCRHTYMRHCGIKQPDENSSWYYDKATASKLNNLCAYKKTFETVAQ